MVGYSVNMVHVNVGLLYKKLRTNIHYNFTLLGWLTKYHPYIVPNMLTNFKCCPVLQESDITHIHKKFSLKPGTGWKHKRAVRFSDVIIDYSYNPFFLLTPPQAGA